MPAPKPEHSGLRRIVHSYRWRHRFVIGGIVAVIAGVVIGIAVVANSNPNSAPHGGRATIVAPPKSVPFTKPERAQVHKALARFLSTAVARKHVSAGWDVVGPGIREGMTRRQWNTGAIPVQPFPVSRHGLGQWDLVQYSYPHHVGLEVILVPKPGSGVPQATANVDVVENHRGHWVVNYFMPNRFHGNPVPGPHRRRVTKQKRVSHHARHAHHTTHKRRVAVPAVPPRNRPGKWWWALPLGILGLIFVIPVTYGIFVWIRNRRAYNAYMRSRAS